MDTRHIAAVTAVLLATADVPADAVIITVPGDQPTIQAGIDAAMNGDEILVAPGTYFETINFLGKAITVRSSDVAEATIIDGTGFSHVVTCNSSEGSDTVLEGFTITGGNTKNGGFLGGGGMLNGGSSPTVIDCTFIGNSANFGGGMHNAGGSPTVINCTFSGNTAIGDAPFGGYGGGMNNENSSPTVTNCTFRGNTAVRAGGGMRNGGRGGSATVTNCILWGNSPDEISSFPPAVTLTYSDVQGGWPGTGNIDADPMFVDPDNGDFRLSPGSSCIDAGDNAAFDPSDCGDCDQPGNGLPGCSDPTCEETVCDILYLCCREPWDSFCADLAGWACQCLPIPEIITDLAGNPRFVDDADTLDTGFGDPPIVDMGAYEFQVEPPCPWDCDNGESIDGTVGIVDFLTLLGQWDGPGSCDFDGGGVGITDFLELLANWGPCP